jgi:hypothetical protein
MFMLALTILGMSLFALSSYEAQFFTASGVARTVHAERRERDGAGEGCCSRCPPHRLENAQLGGGPARHHECDRLSVARTARDRHHLAGPRGLERHADGGGHRREPGGRAHDPGALHHHAGQNPYKLLLSAGTGIRYNLSNGTPPQGFEIRRWGLAVRGDQLRHGLDAAPPVAGRPAHAHDTRASAARKRLRGLEAARGERSPGWSGDHAPYTLTLINPDEQDPEGTVKFFRSPASPADANEDEDGPDEFDWYSFYVDKQLTIRIKGTVVLLVPQGRLLQARGRRGTDR